MEGLTQTLKGALAPHAGVYLGPENLTEQPELPHVIVVPTSENLEPPTQAAQILAGEAVQQVDLICRAATFEDARLLALLCWQVPGLGISKAAQIKYGSESWGAYTARSATLTVTLPIRLTREDVTLARIQEIGFHARYLNPTQQEVSNDQDQANGAVRGDFHEHSDPEHRFHP